MRHDSLHPGAAIRGSLDLRAADVNFVIFAEILFDCGGKPWRGDVKLDRAARQAPPQPEHAGQQDTPGDGAADPDPADQEPVP